jgi:hypothetical protein
MTHNETGEGLRMRRALLRCAAEVSEAAAGYPVGWAQEVLQTAAGHLRSVERVFDLDPTLLDEPLSTGRFRSLDLIAELGRMCRWQVRSAHAPGCNHEERRAEAEAILRRMGEITTRTLAALPRDPAARLRASRDRLAANYDLVRDAAHLLQRTIVAALRQDPLDEQALQLQRTATRLDTLADQLQTEHRTHTDALHNALGLTT